MLRRHRSLAIDDRKGLPVRRKLIIAMGVLALTVAAAPAAAMASTSARATVQSARAPRQQSCPDVEFIGERGSGEKAIAPFRGLGPEVNKMFSVVQGMLHKDGITYGTESGTYPADSVDVLKVSKADIALMVMLGPLAGWIWYYHYHLSKFLGSINDGVSEVVGNVKLFHETCPATVFVLGGYSQGAMVIHQAETELSASLRKTIAGTLLLGDGYRVIKTKAKEFGTSPANGQGVEKYLIDNHVPNLPSVADVPLPKTTANVCNNHDIVCDFNWYALKNSSMAASVHTSYAKCNKKNQCTYEKVLTTAATWVGKAVIHRLIG